ncbi:MAG: hypothetical protein LBC97_12500 [Bifidobacteriaceae bacterium]|jgi:hypothetical protein|nr:hypothetical protein [Bifidobacteriaceae bacterium]
MASAKRHGIGDADILSAYAFALAYFTEESGERPLTVVIGPDRSGAVLLELGVVQCHDYDAICIVQAMPARSASLRKAGLRG